MSNQDFDYSEALNRAEVLRRDHELLRMTCEDSHQLKLGLLPKAVERRAYPVAVSYFRYEDERMFLRLADGSFAP